MRNVAKAGDKQETETAKRPRKSPSKTEKASASSGDKKKTASPRKSSAKAPEPASELTDNQAASTAREDNTTAPQAAPAVQEEVSELDGVKLPAARGRVGVFGGPKDRSAKPDDKLALPTGLHFQYERYRSLNPSHFYCAMRWDYRQNHMSAEEGKRWFANKKIRVTNVRSGVSVVLRAVDYGPHESTGMMMSISPAAHEALGLTEGDEVRCEFADQKARPGVEQ